MKLKLINLERWLKDFKELKDGPVIHEIEVDEFVFGDVLEIDDKYYSCGQYNRSMGLVGVREVFLDLDGEEKEYTDNVICPYCGYEEKDSWELADESEDHECEQCGAIFGYTRDITDEYNSSPVKPPQIFKIS